MKAFKTGDGRRFATEADAIAHANRVAARTGNIIAVEYIPSRVASRAEQHGRYIDSGPGAWDDIGESPDY